MNLLPRFYDIKSGSITIDGVDIRDYTLESLRQNIAVVFQDNFLFSGTIRENILLGNENATEAEIKRAVKMAYLEDFIATLQAGLDTQIGERGILLSGGQKQRVAIARAFLKDAPVIILDEATSALDNKAEAVVQRAIDNLMRDKTVFVIAHRLSTIQNANKIVVINEGKIVEMGTHEELLQIGGERTKRSTICSSKRVFWPDGGRWAVLRRLFVCHRKFFRPSVTSRIRKKEKAVGFAKGKFHGFFGE